MIVEFKKEIYGACFVVLCCYMLLAVSVNLKGMRDSVVEYLSTEPQTPGSRPGVFPEKV